MRQENGLLTPVYLPDILEIYYEEMLLSCTDQDQNFVIENRKIWYLFIILMHMSGCIEIFAMSDT